METLHYEDFGDNYTTKDPFKIWALQEARTTVHNLARFTGYGLDALEVTRSRGESAYRIRFSGRATIDFELAHVEEGLGTKNIIADELEQIYGETFYESVGIDNAASILNDLATTGAAPVSFMLHIGAYPPEWFTDERRAKALFRGTAKACNLAGASWGGGESSTDRDIILPGRALLSGSVYGLIIPPHLALSEDKVRSGDLIVLAESSGVHTNGITLLRSPEFLDRLPNGYQTTLSDGSTYGEALITPSVIYSKFMEELVHLTEVHYASCITGHGWRKLMRPERPFTYHIDKVPEPQPIFELIKKYAKLDDYGMYDTYNMGAGLAVYLPLHSVDKALLLAEQLSILAMVGGKVEDGPRRVIINPIGVEFKEESLQIR